VVSTLVWLLARVVLLTGLRSPLRVPPLTGLQSPLAGIKDVLFSGSFHAILTADQAVLLVGAYVHIMISLAFFFAKLYMTRMHNMTTFVQCERAFELLQPLMELRGPYGMRDYLTSNNTCQHFSDGLRIQDRTVSYTPEPYTPFVHFIPFTPYSRPGRPPLPAPSAVRASPRPRPGHARST